MTRNSLSIGLSLLLCGSLAGAAGTKPKKKAAKAKVATASIEAKSSSTVTGKATFTPKGDQVTLQLDVAKASPGTHAVHVHDKGDCSAPDGTSAGPHWNPTSQPHGKWGVDGHHLGDVGNLEVGADGKGTLTITTNKWTIGSGAPNDLLGHAVVIHGGVDDFKSQPAGNAGPRVGCGVITAEK